MGLNSEHRRSSTQPSKMVKEKIPSPQVNGSLKFQDKLKVENFISEKFVDLNHASRLPTQSKSPGNQQKQWIRSKASKDEELVKHMSNLPGYLQRLDRGENFQEKALNFGVLNWENLEKWKYSSHKPIPATGSSNSSSGSNSSLFTGSSTVSDSLQSETSAHQRNKHSPLHSINKASCTGGLSQGIKPTREKANSSIPDASIAPKSTSVGLNKIRLTDKSFGKNYLGTVIKNSKSRNANEKMSVGSGTPSLNLKNNWHYIKSKEVISPRVGETEKNVKQYQEPDITKKFAERRITSEMEASSTNFCNHVVSQNIKKNVSGWNDQTEPKMEKPQKSDGGLCHHLSPGEHEKIVLLSPQHVPQNSYLEESELSTPRISVDNKHSEANWNSLSDGFSPEVVYSAELYSEIPHSCPLPCTVETNTESESNFHSLTDAQSMELSSDASHSFPFLDEMSVTQTKFKHPERNKFKSLDMETTDLGAKNVRNPSPNQRFSFGIGRISRSLSFKESSAVPRLSSAHFTVNSGPLNSEGSACLDNKSKDKANATNRGRSSPFRRLLDPLLKPKAPNVHHSAKSDQPLEMDLTSSSSLPIDISETLHNEKHKASTVHALLQFTVRNGLPLFKFVVDNNSSILVATVTRSTMPAKDDKDDCIQTFTLYSVNEMKKKSGGWMNQGSKEKSCSYVYNVVGQVNVSSSYSHNLTVEKNSDVFAVKESVLFGVEPRQTDKETPKFAQNRELAAIAIKMPIESVLFGADCHQNADKSCGTTVILPDGVHGLPSTGAPSTLLDRWRSGGSCDCGGWDLGCKLCVLSTQDECCKSSRNSKACTAPDRFELLYEGAAQESKPYFSLAPLKNDIYSVEFKASISFLQAFFICIAVTTCQKSSDLFELRHPSEARVFQEPTVDKDNSSKIQEVVPEKYMPYPPLSPVGRV